MTQTQTQPQTQPQAETQPQSLTRRLLDEIAGIGRDPVRGGYSRHVFTPPELALREWFTAKATDLGLNVQPDANSNLWAWWGEPAAGAVLTGSHLDSVPGGGEFDGPLGVATALAVAGRWRHTGYTPAKPFAVVVFAEEEGGRFGLPCAGSRLAAGAVAPDAVAQLTDADGVSFAQAAGQAGFDVARMGPVDWLAGASAFIELHVEQGKALADGKDPIAIGRCIAPHGRWRLDFFGRGDHAGTTPMAGRADPVVALAVTIVAAQAHALALEGGRATFGRLKVVPGGTNVIASRASGWLDARAKDEPELDRLVEQIVASASRAAGAHLNRLEVMVESRSPRIEFDPDLTAKMGAALPGVHCLDTGAGHDAGVLAGIVPSGMLFVRNPTGASHTPAEACVDADISAGQEALDRVLRELTR